MYIIFTSCSSALRAFLQLALGLRPSLVFRANTISNDMPVYLNTVDAGYKHIVGNCINVFITGMFL